eukprot:6189803-Pleurochrysis_carterae.AAC.5
MSVCDCQSLVKLLSLLSPARIEILRTGRVPEIPCTRLKQHEDSMLFLPAWRQLYTLTKTSEPSNGRHVYLCLWRCDGSKKLRSGDEKTALVHDRRHLRFRIPRGVRNINKAFFAFRTHNAVSDISDDYSLLATHHADHAFMAVQVMRTCNPTRNMLCSPICYASNNPDTQLAP